MAELIDSIGDRVQLPMAFDVDALLSDVQSLNMGGFIHYDVMPLRSPAHLVDPSREFPPPPPSGDYADGSWTEWLDTPAMDQSAALRKVVNYFSAHCTVTLVRLLRLAPGAIVDEHTDPTLGLHIERSVVRLTIPIQSDEDVKFFLNDTLVPMKPGECWYLRLTDPHRITHNGSVERVNMTIDMVPNDWLRELIESTAERSRVTK